MHPKQLLPILTFYWWTGTNVYLCKVQATFEYQGHECAIKEGHRNTRVELSQVEKKALVKHQKARREKWHVTKYTRYVGGLPSTASYCRL